MKTKRLASKRYLVAASLMLIGVLLTCYSAIADAERRGTLATTSTVGGEPGERDKDPDYIEKRGQFLNRFFGTRARRCVADRVRGRASDGTGVASKSALAKREL
jgi:hypothetical protein